MADEKEQGLPGTTPIDAAPENRVTGSQDAGEPRSVKIDMGRGPQPVPRPAGRPARTSGAAIATSAVIALLFGGAGAWAYERYLAQPRAERTPEASASPHRDPATEKEIARLDDRVTSLSEQDKQLESRLESIPKPAVPPDLAPLEQKVARVDELVRQVEAIGKKVDPLPQRLEQLDHKIAEFDAKLDGVRQEDSAAKNHSTTDRESSSSRAEGSSPDVAADSSPASAGHGEPDDSVLATGEAQFREKRYGEAYDIFKKLMQTNPDDARVWYYAALSYGLGSRDWGNMTKMMIQQGVAKEKAGKPQKSVIDTAFAGLTKETGKEWLDFYRRRTR